MDSFGSLASRFGDGTIQDKGGMLHIGGCSAGALAERYGTPLYVYDAERIRSNYRRLDAAFRANHPDFSLCYAVKANNNLSVLRILEREGAGADASSPAEIYLARKAGFGKERILYSGNYQSDDELLSPLSKGLTINLDSAELLERMLSLGLHPRRLSFRINPGLGSSGHEGLVFAGKDVKFGIPEEEAVLAYSLAKGAGVREFGAHMMTGSNILDPGYFKGITERLMEILGRIAREAGISFSFVDIGGGLGVPYRPDDKPLDIGLTAAMVCDAFRKKSLEHGLGRMKLMMEPGRYLVADSGFLLARVHSIKRSGRLFIGTDAGMNTLLRPALYGAYHPILVANRLDDGPEEEATVVGQVCENTDHLARDRMLPKIKRGDLIAVANAGAYGFAMSSQYNTRPRAAEVLALAGKHWLIREREGFADIDRHMVVPGWLRR